MGRPGTKITSFPPQPKIVTIPALPGSSPLPMTLQPQTTPLPQITALPPEIAAEEPIQIDENLTIDELIELRRIIGSKDPRYWAAFDEIQRKRDKIFAAHINSQLKAYQDNTIALYTVNKMKVPETVGQPFQSD